MPARARRRARGATPCPTPLTPENLPRILGGVAFFSV
jgi:hypothetical protein